MSNTFKAIPWLCLLLSSFSEGAVSCLVLNFTFSKKDVCFCGGDCGFYPHFLYFPTRIVVGEDLSLSLALECLSCSRYKNILIFLPHPPGQEGRSVASEQRVCGWNELSLSGSVAVPNHSLQETHHGCLILGWDLFPIPDPQPNSAPLYPGLSGLFPILLIIALSPPWWRLSLQSLSHPVYRKIWAILGHSEVPLQKSFFSLVIVPWLCPAGSSELEKYFPRLSLPSRCHGSQLCSLSPRSSL